MGNIGSCHCAYALDGYYQPAVSFDTMYVAVSYTHLDVYKRQVPVAETLPEGAAQRPSRHAGQCAQSMSLSRLPIRVPSHTLKFSAECISVPVRSYIPAFSRDAAFFCACMPDVYKRQQIAFAMSNAQFLFCPIVF